jgi:hypothetical protein
MSAVGGDSDIRFQGRHFRFCDPNRTFVFFKKSASGIGQKSPASRGALVLSNTMSHPLTQTLARLLFTFMNEIGPSYQEVINRTNALGVFARGRHRVQNVAYRV